MRPSSIRLYERVQRLKAESQMRKEEQKLRKDQLRKTRDRKYATLIGESLIKSKGFNFLFDHFFFFLRSHWQNF